MKLGPYELGPSDTPENGIYCGDARELARAVPDESVDLIFTDPVYQNIEDYRWLAEMGVRVLKPGGNLFVYQAHLFLPATFGAMEHLNFRWIVTEQKIGTQYTAWNSRVLGRTRNALVYFKEPICKRWLVDFTNIYPTSPVGLHRWNKNDTGVNYWLTQFDGAITLDPFAGGGTIPAVCKSLGYQYLAFEIDPATCALARERVRNTQPPLFTLPQPEQVEMNIG